MRTVFLSALLCLGFIPARCEVNYFNYHRDIVRAESLFFIGNTPKPAFEIYDRILNSYKFVFVCDYFMAAQMACEHRDTQRVYRYLTACFKNGLRLDQLSLSPVLIKSGMQENNCKLQLLYDAGRKEYLSGIDYNYRGKVYQIYCEDQIDKELPRDQYNEKLLQHLDELLGYIKAKGFPSDRLVGIDDSSLVVNGRTILEWNRKIRRKRLLPPDDLHGRGNDDYLAGTMIIPFLLHYPCAFQKLEPCLLAEIKKGNLHPRDLGLVYDNMNRMSKFMDDHRLACAPISNQYYKLNYFNQYPEKWRDAIPQIDSMRQTMNICTIAQDAVKRRKCDQLGFYNKTGWWSCRGEAAPPFKTGK